MGVAGDFVTRMKHLMIKEELTIFYISECLYKDNSPENNRFITIDFRDSYLVFDIQKEKSIICVEKAKRRNTCVLKYRCKNFYFCFPFSAFKGQKNHQLLQCCDDNFSNLI